MTSPTNNHSAPRFVLSPDESFHFELLRNLSHATFNGADVNEVLQAAARITAGDFESFYLEFFKLAEHVKQTALSSSVDNPSGKVSARNAFFRAATYYRAADFYLHGNPSDPRIESLWKEQTECFDKAIALLPQPGRRHTLQADGFKVPIIYYSAGGSQPRPTLILGSGYDGAQEEMLHEVGFAALERGWDCLTYDGPGQPGVRRKSGQGLGFIHDWERVVTPVVDWLEKNANNLGVDMKRIGLWGQSMGGYLCVRAAAFEHRLAAVMSIDGVYDVGDAFTKNLPPPMRQLLHDGKKQEFDAIIARQDSANAPTTLRWAVSQGLWAMLNEGEPRSAYEFLAKAAQMSMKGLGHKVSCPVFVGNAEIDMFFKGQPELLAAELGDKATHMLFTEEDAAGHHCHVGAGQFMCQKVCDWFQTVAVERV